jgi:hypothetical protein
MAWLKCSNDSFDFLINPGLDRFAPLCFFRPPRILFDLCLLFGCVSVRYIAGRTEGSDTLFENRLIDFDLKENDIEKIDSEIESHEGIYRKNSWGGYCQDDLDGDKINID